MSYYIRQTKSREYTLEYKDNPIYKLIFPSWKSSNAMIQLTDGTLQFNKKSFWKNEYTLTKDKHPIGKITSNWKGHFFLHLLNQPDLVPSSLEIPKEENDYTIYTLKAKGLFTHRYELYHKKDPRPLITLKSKSKWFKVNYEVKLHHEDIIPFPITEIIGILVFCSVLIRKRQAAVAGGAAAS